MRFLALLLLTACAPLHSLTTGNACIEPGKFTGDTITGPEKRKGTITRVYGPSTRCLISTHPNLADVDWATNKPAR